MSMRETLITGFGLELPNYIKVADSDDAEYYEDVIKDDLNVYWDYIFTSTGLKLVFGSDKYYLGDFSVEESTSIDPLYVDQSTSFKDLEDSYTKVKYALFKLKQEYPQFEKFIEDARDVKFLNRIIYT